MNNAALELRTDRTTIERFVRFYSRYFSLALSNVSYPEDLSDTPKDARIDAIYGNDQCTIHLEHTSIDLIVSGRVNKRSLDPGFLLLERELKKVVCLDMHGVNVSLRLEYAKDIPRIKRIAPLLAKQVSEYLASTDPIEWTKYPRISDVLTVDEWEFQIRPDVLRDSEVKLHWAGSDMNFLEPKEVESSIANLIPPKIAKLDRSLELSESRGFGILIVETSDIAAESFHSRCGMFARTIAPLNSKISEIWGLHGNSDPTLVWSEFLDEGRLDCAYCEDSAYRTCAEIQDSRMSAWMEQRRRWFAESSS